ncbi:MAG: hypothetical protein J1E59_02125 [Treponema sp.]|nr:hypothetical protein [Treponema sp.]
MSGNSNEKRPHGRLFKNFIGGLFFSFILWGLFIFLVVRTGGLGDEYKGLSILLYCGIGIILGIFGAMGYVLVKLWSDFFYSHFIVFTRSPILLLLTRYIIDPAIGVFVFPILIFCLVMKLMGKA